MHFITGELNAAARQLEERTNRSLEEWAAMVRREGPLSRKDRRDWLMGEYWLELSEAEAVLVQVEKGGMVLLDDADARIPELFTGDAAEAAPLFRRLTALFKTFGDDISAQRNLDFVLFFHNWPFAVAKPLEDGLQVGAAIPGGVEVGDRMSRVDGSEHFPPRINFKVFIGIMEELNGEVVRLLREAYESS